MLTTQVVARLPCFVFSLRHVHCNGVLSEVGGVLNVSFELSSGVLWL